MPRGGPGVRGTSCCGPWVVLRGVSRCRPAARPSRTRDVAGTASEGRRPSEYSPRVSRTCCHGRDQRPCCSAVPTTASASSASPPATWQTATSSRVLIGPRPRRRNSATRSAVVSAILPVADSGRECAMAGIGWSIPTRSPSSGGAWTATRDSSRARSPTLSSCGTSSYGPEVVIAAAQRRAGPPSRTAIAHRSLSVNPAFNRPTASLVTATRSLIRPAPRGNAMLAWEQASANRRIASSRRRAVPPSTDSDRSRASRRAVQSKARAASAGATLLWRL